MSGDISTEPVQVRALASHTGAYRVLPSSVLFAGKKEVRIHHAGVEYVLRITKEQKLVLTK